MSVFWWVELYFFSLFSRAVGREGGMLQTNDTGVRSQYLSHTGSAPAHGACITIDGEAELGGSPHGLGV